MEHEDHKPTEGEIKLEEEVEKEAEELIESEDNGELNEDSEDVEEDSQEDDVDLTQVKETPEMVKIRERLSEIKGKMLTLKWDVEHGQLNPGKQAFYDKLKKECEGLEAELKSALDAQK